MHKNKFIITLTIFYLILLYSSLAFCGIGVSGTVGTCDPSQVEKYQFTIKKFEISYDNGATWTTAWEGTETFNVCDAAGPSSLAKTIFSNLSVEAGTINKIRITAGAPSTVRGYVTLGGNTYKTVAGTNQFAVAGSTGAGNSYSWEPALGENGIQTVEEDRNIVIASGESKRFKIIFNLENALGLLAVGPFDYAIVPRYVSPAIEEE